MNKIQVAKGNCKYFMLKGFNMKDIYVQLCSCDIEYCIVEVGF